MSKAILLSIRPEWCAKILNGEKFDEIRSKFPINYVGWVYIYCTKDKNLKLYQGFAKPMHTTDITNPLNYHWGVSKKFGGKFNGKVIARFWVDDVDELKCEFHDYELFGEDTVYQGIDLIYRYEDDPEWYDHFNLVSNEDGDTNEEVYENNAFLKRCCLTLEDFKKYAKKKETLYDIHISKLEKFDKPKELNEFYGYTDKKVEWYTGLPKVKVISSLSRAPQSRQYIEVEE